MSRVGKIINANLKKIRKDKYCKTTVTLFIRTLHFFIFNTIIIRSRTMNRIFVGAKPLPRFLTSCFITWRKTGPGTPKIFSCIWKRNLYKPQFLFQFLLLFLNMQNVIKKERAHFYLCSWQQLSQEVSFSPRCLSCGGVTCFTSLKLL